MTGMQDAKAQKFVRGRVLVVDDEPVLLMLMCQILRFDHEVDGTSDPRDAFARVERGERYDVILCDLVMPGMTGMELHGRIRDSWPDVAEKMIFLTAGAFTEEAGRFLDSGEVVWFEKPIDPDRLRAFIATRVAALH